MTKLSFSEIEEAHKKGWCILWRLGSKDYPASPDDIIEFQQLLSEAMANKLDIIWKHDVDFIYFDPNTKGVVKGVE